MNLDPTGQPYEPAEIETPNPRPGSDEALAQGCKCPVLDNGHGRGRGGDGNRYGWVISENCPLHGSDGKEWWPRDTKLAAALRLGDRFYVEPIDGSNPIPVELIAPGHWGLVNGVMHLPVLRLDTSETTEVEIPYNAPVKRVPDEQ